MLELDCLLNENREVSESEKGQENSSRQDKAGASRHIDSMSINDNEDGIGADCLPIRDELQCRIAASRCADDVGAKSWDHRTD